MKKFLACAILAVAFIFAAGQTPQAEAYEQYVGSYSDGSSVYLLTETIVIKSHSPYQFNCRVRAGRDYLNYYFSTRNGSPFYRNNEGYSGYVFGGASPVAASIYRFVVNNY